ncbi:hypothetical protein CVD25_01085 [Bacillus canaveralius]|uniref:Uncharacterized protein n=1 Tax=Bacillus canaveralius TaxID=1403243 RepID=A0A2N5GPM7_9BACI|nr:hypothetical protein [Bacillus canaveralius]PLR84658.1 hypothetical protein CU635_06195 [Bacillus canaveralius]PLS00810.1 hypothetical protein CVD25_01085 [Bacillus canaveralius]
MPQQPPNTNGQMILTELETSDIKGKLQVIKDAFEPSDEQPAADTFYLTVAYNRANPVFLINGDTVEMLLLEMGNDDAKIT